MAHKLPKMVQAPKPKGNTRGIGAHWAVTAYSGHNRLLQIVQAPTITAALERANHTTVGKAFTAPDRVTIAVYHFPRDPR